LFSSYVKINFFFYLNRSSLSINFIKKAFYRKFKRIKQRFYDFDKQDKVFLFFATLSCFIGSFAFWYLENPSLKIVDTYFVHTIFLLYFYLLSKKVANLNYFPSIIVFLMSCPSMMFIVFSFITYVYDDTFYLHEENRQELSFLMQLVLEGLNSFSFLLENSSSSMCQPIDPVQFPKIPVPDLPQLQPISRGQLLTSIKHGFEHGCMGVGVSTALNATPRVRVATGITVGGFSFLSHLFS
jgi:hypothetical protein